MDDFEFSKTEDKLIQAMLCSDVRQLDQLLSDTLVFTNHDGVRLTKADDIAAYSSGLLKIEKLTQIGERIARRLGNAVVVCVTFHLTGSYAGQMFQGAFAYSRVWYCKSDRWQVEAGHCSQVATR